MKNNEGLRRGGDDGESMIDCRLWRLERNYRSWKMH